VGREIEQGTRNLGGGGVQDTERKEKDQNLTLPSLEEDQVREYLTNLTDTKSGGVTGCTHKCILRQLLVTFESSR